MTPKESSQVGTAWDWVVQNISSYCDLSDDRVRFLELGHDSTPDLSGCDIAVARLRQRCSNFAGFVATPSTQVFLILEDWLQGYRRLIPPQIQAFYWYETYRLLPKITPAHPNLAAESAGISSKPPTRDPIFCFAPQSESRRSLCGALVAMECNWIAAGGDSALPAGKPKLVFWYPEESPKDMESDRKFLDRLVTAYPDSLKVRVTNFPRFESARYFLDHGIDFEVDAAYDLSAILEVADRFSSAALRRK